jgi:hypothetical protein
MSTPRSARARPILESYRESWPLRAVDPPLKCLRLMSVRWQDGRSALRSGHASRTGDATLDRLVVSALLTDKGGALWIGTRASGLDRSDASGLKHFTSQEGLLGNQVRAPPRRTVEAAKEPLAGSDANSGRADDLGGWFHLRGRLRSIACRCVPDVAPEVSLITAIRRGYSVTVWGGS